MKAATNASGCRSCGAGWTETQLVFRADDGTWWTTCPECGSRQQWVWLHSVDSADGAPPHSAQDGTPHP